MTDIFGIALFLPTGVAIEGENTIRSLLLISKSNNGTWYDLVIIRSQNSALQNRM